MYTVNAHRINDNAILSQSVAHRDWMEETYDRHAYNCFPITLTNTLGWTISFPEDISFVWNGIANSDANNVVILKGDKYAHSGRANSTVSFKTGIILNTENNITILTMPVPNLFNEDYQVFTSLISTSFFSSEFPLVVKAMTPNKVITIKANTPIANILPISLGETNNSELIIDDVVPSSLFHCDPQYAEEHRKEILKTNKWTNFYRNAVDPCGNVLGSHEAKKIIMKVVDKNAKN